MIKKTNEGKPTMTIQTIALENIADKNLNPGFDSSTPFFESPMGLKTIDYLQYRLQKLRAQQAFSKVLEFRLHPDFLKELSRNRGIEITHPKLGSAPQKALFLSAQKISKSKSVLVKVRVLEI